ncbi:MAG TPA: NAD/NADP octopine/nopaline dehydrogenase family protein [Candidatus Eisenbacteria bacterium]|nr:NAD/NADP octopine/nopaline dehydrogenase family protein [Candidatus Eisenbacteria bacterium]
MKVTIIGAGNSGLAMAAHLSQKGSQVTLWNRSYPTIEILMDTHIIKCEGIVSGEIPIHLVTDDIELALKDPDIILITTPASSHMELAELIAKNIYKSTAIVLNPGRTFGALKFKNTYYSYNKKYPQIVAEAQTCMYTCRKIAPDAVEIIAIKNDIPIFALDLSDNRSIINYLPVYLQQYFSPVDSMIQTSIGNVGMILHCAPLLLNAGWTENELNTYSYYYDGISPTIGSFLEKLDDERVTVSEALGYKVESTKEWLARTYDVNCHSLYECIQNVDAYRTIEAPKSLCHRYIYEDIPCGLVPLEAIGLKLDLNMSYSTLIIDLASKLLDVDFRKIGRNLNSLGISEDSNEFLKIFEKRLLHE